MSITYDQAIAQLLDPTKYSSLNEIKSLIPQISGEVFDPNTGLPSTAERLLYNGKLPDGTWASTMANTLANDGSGKYTSIFKSEVGKFLDDPRVTDKIRQLCDQVGQSFDVFMGGSIDAATGIRTNGLWDTASINYVTDTANGNFRILVDKPTVGSTFAVNEIDALIARTSAGLPTTIQGVSANEILKVYTGATGTDQARNLEIFGKAINAAGEITAVKTGVADVATASMTAAERSTYLQSAFKILQKGGPYAAALSALVVAGEASAAYSQGNTAEGNSIVAAWVAEMGAGWAAGAAAGSAAFYATAWMNGFGPIGSAANFLITAGAGIYGGYIGGDAAANYTRMLLQETGVTTTEGNYQVTRFSNGMEHRVPMATAGGDYAGPDDILFEVVVTAPRLTPPIAGAWTLPNADGTVTQIGYSDDRKFFAIEQKSDATSDATSVKYSTITINAGGVHNTSFNQDGTWSTVTTDPATHEITSRSTTRLLNGGGTEEIIVNADGSTIQRMTDAAGNITDVVIETGAQTLAKAIETYGSTVIDALSIIKAIQSGDPLPIAVSGLRLANDLNSLNGTVNLNLSGVANVGGSILSVLSLEQALQRGDTLAAVTAGAQALSFGAMAYAEFAAESAMTAGIENAAATQLAYNEAQAFSSTLGSAVAALNLVNAISHGDAIGAAMAVLSMNPATAPIAIAYTVFNIISSLFGDDDPPPEPWGNASAKWSGFSVVASAYGAEGGQGTAEQTYNGFISYLNQLAAYEQSVNPGSAIGVIANRLPSLTYRNYSGFGITDIDPITGVQRDPSIRYDLTGRPYNAPPGSDQASQSLSERFIRVALARGAIAPMWEVQTAALQTQAGDPKAGLTEEERAGRNGQLAAPATGAEQLWRPVALDLNGDGVQTTGAVKAAAFDVDDTGFLKNTAWLNNNDGFLFLDRNLNGQIDSARELFSNAIVALSARGLNGMSWVDANYDGKLTAADPVWNELKIWQDANGDGQAEAGEVKSLSTLGITALDYAMGTFEQNGQLKQMSSPDLAADTAGTRTQVVPEGIVVQTSNGQVSLLVTRIDDRTVIEANRDGITSYEDTEAIVSTADLMANDTLGGFAGLNLSVTGVSDFTHGTGYLDGNGFVHYTPNANYNGAASFSYTIQAPTGQTATATVDINLLNMNDAPTATIDQHIRPVYGYANVSTTYDEYGNSTTTLIDPQYAPYKGYDYSSVDVSNSFFEGGYLGLMGNYGYHDTPVTYVDYDGPNAGSIFPSDIDDPTGSFTYRVATQPQFGDVELDASGGFHYFSWSGPNTRNNKDLTLPTDPNATYASGTPGRGIMWREATLDPFTVQVTDPHGASTTIQVNAVHVGNYNPSLGSGGGGDSCPIAIDLDGNGFSFTPVDDSNVFFEVNDDGWKHKVSWLNPNDGWLAYDIDGDGKIARADELSFAGYQPGAQTDLEGLKAFDTNGDGILSALDEKWGKFGIWQDANSDGMTDLGEYKSLDELGVASINLASDGQFSVIDGQTVHGIGTVTKTDGSTLQFADVTMKYSDEVLLNNSDGTSQVVTKPPFSPSGEELNGTDGKDLILGKSGNNIVNAGADDDVVMEDGGNDVIDGGVGNDTIYSGADNDLVMAGAGDDVVFAGLGDDLLLGDEGHDALFGEVGNDVLFGDKGNDLISGDSGNDVLSGDAGDDQVYGGSGNDAVFGGEGNDELAGMDGYDRLDGGTGNDLLDGGADADEMIGGVGDDIYVVDNVGDIVTENPDEGIDSVRSSISYVLGANLENLTLTGSENLTGAGNAADNELTGNNGDNLLVGGAGNDTLDGGMGADTLIGGAGGDTYLVDNTADIVVETADEGNDTVLSSVSYALADNVENLVLTGRSASDASGNALNNLITGNIADNILDGGAGADTLTGGRGNDTYVVDNAGDRTIELASEGVDTVVSSLSWTLAENVENLALIGTDNLTGTGNELDNVIVGNAGNNRIDGGLSADTMAGGAGDDAYIVDNTADTTVENVGEGMDTVYASVSYGLAANMENLTLTGTMAIDGTGNELDNVLTGNDSANLIYGGEGNDVFAGNGGNDTLDGGAGADMMAGGQGDDVYVVDNAGDAVMENAAEGADTVLASVSYGLDANVENLALTGASNIGATGNQLDNTLLGNAGNNVLDGAAGADTMVGGAGDDIYIVDATDDQVFENVAEGNDTVEASVDYTLTGNVENLVLAGTANLAGTGNELDNVLTGSIGNDTLDGGAGADIMAGGQGDDVYVVDIAGDVVMENAAEGTDTVFASVSYGLASDVENLTLTGSGAVSATGNELANVLAGNEAANLLYGVDGNDMLIGNGGNDMLDGGAGADTMAGGAGDDAYIVDNTADTTVENVGEGMDTVYAGVSYGLAANLENLTLTGTMAIDGTGNELDNTVSGNDGNNRLLGAAGNDTLIGNGGNDILDGGTGADVMAGGMGDDAYVVESIGDLVTEQLNAGIDDVYASISYVLPENVENLALTGTDAIDGIGNGLDNMIVGNGAANLLDGGAGADTLAGGAGNDTYVVDNAGDAVAEAAGEGIDQVNSSVNYALTDNVENLTLTGTAAINGTGNILDNAIAGNSANNTLDGGLGADTLTGGAGDDIYIVDNAGDRAVELAGEGTDSVYASVSYVLADNVENLYFTGTGNVDASGNSLANRLVGNAADNRLHGGAGDDLLFGNAGNDFLDGGTGNDLLNGDTGNDTYLWRKGDGLDGIYDTSGNDAVQFGEGLGLDNLTLRVTDEGGVRIAHLRALNEGGCEMADQGFDFLVETDRCGKTISPIEKFYLADGTALTFDDLLIKTEVTKLRPHDGTLITGRNDDIIYGSGRSDLIYAGTGNDIVYASAAKDTVYGQGGNDALYGGSGSDTLDGGCGNDLLFGSAGRDMLYGGGGNNLLDGGVDNDVLVDGTGNSFFAGGRGNDTLSLGGGNDIVAFNRGDGKDVVEQGSGNLTLSLGREIRARDLSLGRSGQDLILKVGGSDSVTLTGWYTAHGNTTLQMVQDGNVKAFDFNGLAAAFDGVTAKECWAVANALPGLQLSSSGQAAIGGDLAYRYGADGDVGDLSIKARLAVLSDTAFGEKAQRISVKHVTDHSSCDLPWGGDASHMAKNSNPDSDFNKSVNDGSMQGGEREQHGKQIDSVQERIDAMLQHWFESDSHASDICLSQYEGFVKGYGNDQRKRHTDSESYAERWQQLQSRLDRHLASSLGADFGGGYHHGENGEGLNGLGSLGMDFGKGSGFMSGQNSDNGGFQKFKGLREGITSLGW